MTLRALGWSAHWQRAFAAFGRPGMPGRVAAVERGRAVVWTEGGEREAERGVAGVVTGDWVVFDDGLIRGVLPRKTKLSRKQPGRRAEEQVLVANIDVLLVTLGLDGDFNVRRLERYLVAAAASGLRAAVVLNKADLCPDPLPFLSAARASAPGAEVVLASAATGAGLEAVSLLAAPGETAVLAGSSGVGKSSLVNRLLGREVMRVEPVRASDGRGTHTTTRRELFMLEARWLLADTPGLREFQPWDAEAGFAGAFPEIAELAARCRFRDCAHAGEPGCAVAAAIARGDLDASRLAGFHKLRAEAAFLERQTDIHAAIAEKNRIKRIHRAMRDA